MIVQKLWRNSEGAI